MSENEISKRPLPISDEVVTWLLLLRSDNASQHDLDAFQAWRIQDIRHERAWQQLSRSLDGKFGRLNEQFPPPALQVAQIDQLPGRRNFVKKSMAMAASTAFAAFVLNEFYPLSGLAADEATSTGQRKRVALADGSALLLDARTRINVKFDPNSRRIQLLEGAVAAAVAPDRNRPFTIETRQGSVRALGTRYMVRQEMRRSLVVVEEHDVEIRSASGATGQVRAGMGARFDSTLVDTPRAELFHEAAWEQGWIRARDRPLLQVINALRPYRAGEIRLTVAAGALPVTGEFPLDNTDRALTLLAQQLPIHISQFTPWYVAIDVA